MSLSILLQTTSLLANWFNSCLLAQGEMPITASSSMFFFFSTFICTGVIIVLMVLVLPLMIAFVRSATIRNAFHEVARRRLGTYFSNGLFHAPEVTFRKQGVLYRVRMTRSRENRLNQVLFITANWPDRSFRMRIVPGPVDHSVGRQAEMQDVHVGDAVFDSAFVLQSNAEGKLLTLFSDDVKQSLQLFSRNGAGGDFEIRVIGGVMSLRRQAMFSRHRLLQSQVEGFVELHQLMMAARVLSQQTEPLTADEVKFLSVSNSSFAIDAEETPQDVTFIESERIPVCQVCGTDIENSRVECRSCDTAHHRECWDYIGKCSTFACGEQRFAKPGKRKRGKRKADRWPGENKGK